MFQLLEKDKKERPDFPDKRLEKRYTHLNDLLESGQSSVLNQISLSRKERKGGYDFYKNSRVTESVLQEKTYGSLEKRSIRGEHLLVLQDTTEYNFASNKDRIKDKRGLGTLRNEFGLGFFSHTSLVLNATELSVVGISDLQIWNREKGRPGSGTRKQRNFEDKESYKWHVGMSNSHDRLVEAKKITYVQDRDGDIYESITKVIERRKAELLVRSCRDRRIELKDGRQCMLYGYLADQEVSFSYELKIRGDKRNGRSGRIAKLDVRSARVKLVRPANLTKKQPPYVEVDVVWVRENPLTVPAGESAVDWKLITTHEVIGEEVLIKQVIQWYANRWIIEEFFLSQRQEPTTWKMLYWKQDMVCAN